MSEDVQTDVTNEPVADAGEATKQPAGTLVADPSADAAPKAPADFPDDWRQKLAGEDEKALKLLERLGSPADMVKKLSEQEKTIRSGKHKEPLGKDATPEQIAEYRAANGIPDTPAGYFDKLDGLVIGDDDKPAVTEFLAAMHETNAAPEQVGKALNWYFSQQEAQQQAQLERDTAFRAEAQEALRSAMGGDYRANMNDLKAWLGSQEGMLETFANARAPDGTLLGDNPAVVGWLVQQMREINPLSTVVPGGGGGSLDSVNAEIAKIEKVMREDLPAYQRDSEMQARLLKLYQAQEKAEARAR
jgi:hypothetical protein